MNEISFLGAFNYHSYGRMYELPWACKAKSKQGHFHNNSDENKLQELAHRLIKSNGYTTGRPSTNLYPVDGDASGKTIYLSTLILPQKITNLHSITYISFVYTYVSFFVYLHVSMINSY